MHLLARFSRSLLVVVAVGCTAPGAVAQTLETETARLLRAGVGEMRNAYELQFSSEGTEAAIPMAFEYGVSNNLELLLEPVAYTAIRPKVGRQATGLGDLEATLTYRFRQESRRAPALAAAAEVKFPTATDNLIGTLEPDYTAYLIASKRLGGFDTHANIGYTFLGRPDRANIHDIVDFALAAVYRPESRLVFFGEVLGNTSSGPEGETGTSSPGNAVIPEAAGGELVGTLGAGTHLSSSLWLDLGVSYDNNSAVQLRPGFSYRFR